MDFNGYIKTKIVTLPELLHHREQARIKNKKVVFTNGCFDIIHLGHVDYLSKARDLGDMLIVAVNTDNSVRKLKGDLRPVQNEISRSHTLAAFSFIDYVILFDTPTPYELIKAIQPDILVKGADYKPEEIVGYDILKQTHGEVKTIEFLNGYSTTGIINKILQKN